MRAGMRQLFSLPDGYEVVLGNGGTTCFWDAATFGLIEEQSQHLSFGEFSSKFAACAKAAPAPQGSPGHRVRGRHPPDAGGRRERRPLRADPQRDLHRRVDADPAAQGAAAPIDGGGLVAVDATSGAGGLRVDPAEFDAYYLAPQKCFAGDGGLWIALLSPAAVDRVERIAASGRWIPTSLDLKMALDNSALDQTYNTPALATIFLLAEQLDWMNEQRRPRMDRGALRPLRRDPLHLGGAIRFARPFVENPADRSHVVGTIDFVDAVDAAKVAAVLRANGIVDTEPYRKLGRNQLRIAMFPAIEPDDIALLCACITHVVGALA